jgi:hypothetical protein
MDDHRISLGIIFFAISEAWETPIHKVSMTVKARINKPITTILAFSIIYTAVSKFRTGCYRVTYFSSNTYRETFIVSFSLCLQVGFY